MNENESIAKSVAAETAAMFPGWVPPLDDLPGEIWKPIPGFEGRHEVSNMGRVKNPKRKIVRTNRWKTPYQVRKQPGIRKQGLMGKAPYRFVSLWVAKSNRMATFHVHRLVLEAFVGPRPKGCNANWLDGNRQNNRLDNLEWRARGKLNQQEAIAAKLIADSIAGLKQVGMIA